MELKCALVLTLVGVAAGTPYNSYGIKGGAAAKADAAALAGAFSGAGPIPAGSGFAGSFSKSSSSSFASSSAGSSSSSFSYSGSGSFGPGGVGCATGECQKGTNDVNNPGTSFPAFSGANAGAIAAAGTIAGSYSPNGAPCTSRTCSGQKPTGCQGFNCGDTTKCTSDKCDTPSSSNGPDDEGNNDIPVNVAGTAASQTTSKAVEGSQYDKSGSSYQPLGCSNGKCGSPSNTNPTYPQTNPGTGPDHLKPKCNTLNCNDNHHSESQGNPKVPATYLTAPKVYPNPGTGSLPLNYNVLLQNSYLTPSTNGKDAQCASGKCDNKYPDVAYNPANGDSYSTNYLGPNFPTEQKDLFNDKNENCASGICGTNPSSAPSTTGTYSGLTAPGYSQRTGPDGNCASGKCGSYPSTAPAPTGTYLGSKAPAYSGTSSGPNCANGNCGSYPSSASIPAPSSSAPSANCANGNCGSYPSPAPTASGSYAGSKATAYSPTSSAPSDNCANGNCGSYPSSAPSTAGSYPGPKPTSYSPEPTSPSGNCANGNCGSYPSSAPSTAGSYPGPKPTIFSSEPTFPSGNCANGNCGSYPSSISSTAGSYPGSKPTSYSTEPTAPSGNCANGNCGNYPSSVPSTAGSYPGSKVPGYSPKPTGPSGSCANGNCGSFPSSDPSTPGSYPGPKALGYSPTASGSNCANGNCASYPSSAPSPTGASTYPASNFPSYSQGTSPVATAPTSCRGSNCAGVPSQPSSGSISKPSITYTPPFTSPSNSGPHGSASGANAAVGSFGTSKPGSGIYPSPEDKLPSYTGGFGGPTGILKPDDYSLPSKPAYPTGQHPTSQPAHPGTSTFPSTALGVAPTSPTSNYYNKPSCASGNCGSPASQSSPSFGSNPNKGLAGAVAGASASASANAVAYSGGFGGPPGLLKPYDDGKLGSKPSAASQDGLQAGSYSNNANSNHQPAAAHPGTAGAGNSLPYSVNGGGNAAQAGASAHAAAGAAAGAFNTGSNQGSGSPHGGCNGGCGGNGGSPYGGGNFALSNSGAIASAKSLAGATSGPYSQAGSFASSSANAHASSGFPTKGETSVKPKFGLSPFNSVDPALEWTGYGRR